MLLYNMDCIQGIFVSSCYILGLSKMSRLHVNAYWSIIFLKIKNVKDSENIKELISWEELRIQKTYTILGSTEVWSNATLRYQQLTNHCHQHLAEDQVSFGMY